jgi:2-phosphosulfolactate phosphatase
MNLETILSPLELSALVGRDLRGTACVVFDVLRATSAFITALQNGAVEILPVAEIAEAVALRKANPQFLLAGERDGVRIRAAQSGGTDFDVGNSPREFTPERVSGKTIVSSTTNGTRALRACAGAETVLASSFLNLAATANFLRVRDFATVLLICAGTGNAVALEDVLAAGAMIDLLLANSPVIPALSLQKGEEERCNAPGQSDSSISKFHPMAISDSSRIAHDLFVRLQPDLPAAVGASKNGRRLLSMPDLHDDVAFCAQRDVFQFVARMDRNGRLCRI